MCIRDRYGPGRGTVPGGVKCYTARSGPITLTRVQISRPGLERPAGRYSTLEIPSLAVVDDKDEKYVSAVAGEVRALLPAVGPVLVLSLIHISPVTDTTILSAQGSGCALLDHVKTQMPYALTVAATATLMGTLPAGFGVSPALTLPLGMAVLAVVLFKFGKHPAPAGESK